MQSVLIGIQARSGSTRLPRKAFELIGGKCMLDHVIDAAKSAQRYLQRWRGLTVDVAVLTPKGDPIAEAFKSRCLIHQGSESDVLSRYYEAGKGHDFVVRLTGDCPLIPDYLILKHVKTAIAGAYDYVSNVDEDFRTAVDGHDCEVIGQKMLEWVQYSALEKADREHVTTLIRRETPDWASVGFVINYLDHSGTKFSVDTPEDLARVREEFDRRERKQLAAERRFGKRAVHRL
jgi:spore coat polysaccharide biosynthesis protein SpsF (cytidylyltransferase family)